MRAGYGAIEITPPMGVELAGYGYYLERKCTSVRDPLFLRAVLLEENGIRQLLVCFDLLGVSQGIADRVILEAAALGVPRDRVLIVSIHTHTGPVIQYHNGCGEVDPDYIASLETKIRPALEAASGDLSEVTRLSFVHEPVPGDELYNRATPEGPVDRDARGFFLSRKENAPILLASAACHGVFLRCIDRVSADFSGELHALCAEAGIRSMYLNGLCGDIDPWQPSPDRMKAFAEKLFHILTREGTDLPLTLEGGRLPFTLRLEPMTLPEIHAAAARAVEKAGGPEKPAARSAIAWEKEMESRYDSLAFEEPGDAAFCVLGGIPVLALPFEGFTRIGLDFRRLTGQPDALVLGCAEQLRGYLPTRDDFERNSYAARESMFLYRRLPPLPGEAERLAEQLAAGWKNR